MKSTKKKLSNSELEKQQRVIKLLTSDFIAFCKYCLFIVNQLGQKQPLELNHEQIQLTKYVMQCILDKKPIRIIVLKSRKVGVSTWALALAYWLATFNEDFSAILAAHLQGSAKEIAQIAKRFSKWQPAILPKNKENGPGLVWKNDSSLRVVTARSSDTIRGATPRFLLLSEAAFYDENRVASSGEDFLSGALTAVPEAPNTFIILESSPPRGKAGTFAERWHSAYRALLRKDDSHQYKAFFFSWIDSPELPDNLPLNITEQEINAHKILISTTDDKELLAAAQKLKYPSEWIERAREHKLSIQQVRWAIRKQESTYGGNLVRFDREYPLTPALAFSASGRLVFPENTINSIQANSYPEETIYCSSIIDKQPSGIKKYWEIYQQPQRKHNYVIGVDVSSGVGSDYSAIEVIDRHTGEQVAEYYCNTISPGELAQEVFQAAQLYNNALIVPERNADGGVVIQKLVDLQYFSIYRRDSNNINPGLHYLASTGYLTTPASRPRLISKLQERIRSGSLVLHSHRLASEFGSFVYNRVDKPDHQPGCHSDLIIALALAVEGDESMGPVTAIREIKEEPIDYQKANQIRHTTMISNAIKKASRR